MHASRQQINDKKIGMLLKRADFLRVGKAQRKWVSKSMIVQMGKRPAGSSIDPAAIRYGITVTKKTYKAAVKRNRIKRRLRACAQEALLEGGLPGHDYVLIGRQDTLSLPYSALVKDLRWCLKRLGTQT